MVKSIGSKLAREFPEVLELNSILSLAEITWRKYGISAISLSEQDDYMIEILRILVNDS